MLVIIGLIVGGIFAGLALMRAAELKKVGSTAIQLGVKVRQFKDLYGQLPGDTNKAWAFWGEQCASSQALCNGNGNWKINSRHYSSANGPGAYAEDECVYRHLALAGLWDGASSVAACSIAHNSGITKATIASNPEIAPKAIDDMYYHITSWALYQRDGSTVSVSKPTDAAWGGTYVIGGTLPLLDARSLDDKFDDGGPASGQVYSSSNLELGGSSCVSTAVYTSAPASVSWSTNIAAKGCNVHFWVD